MTSVVMIEDDVDFATLLSEYLAQFNIKITNFEDPKRVLDFDMSAYDCLILDLTLPGIDGLELCRKIRSTSDIPIIISSARGDISDKFAGLQIGADDYLPKPYDPKEMYARISSLIRRSKKASVSLTTHPENSIFTLDEKRHEIKQDDKVLSLTPAEFEIMEYFIKNHSFSVSREDIVKNCRSLSRSSSKSVDVIIGRLREKLGDKSKNPHHIISVRGIGYKLIG